MIESDDHNSKPLTHVRFSSKPRPPLQVLSLICNVWAFIGIPVKMPEPKPEPVTRLRAIVLSNPQNMMPEPTQTLSMTRPFVERVSPSLVARMDAFSVCTGPVLLM